MFGLTGGEWFVVIFVTVAVVSAHWWPWLGERIAVALSRNRTSTGPPSKRDRPGS